MAVSAPAHPALASSQTVAVLLPRVRFLPRHEAVSRRAQDHRRRLRVALATLNPASS